MVLIAVFLLLLFYAAVVVKEERAAFLESARTVEVRPFAFGVPSWWRVSEGGRVWESGDWRAEVRWVEGEVDALAVARGYLKRERIEFDEEGWECRSRMVRFEGPATWGDDRRYVDVFAFRGDGGVLLAVSKSAVLSGVVEGPYFEEVMLSLKRGGKPAIF